MRLIQLSANKDSFHPITFNNEGLSIIRAIKISEDKKGTYNSTGKSFLIYLIHFCLGASESNELKEKLPEWEFFLKFKIDETEYISKRSTDNQKFINLNNKDYKISEFNELIGSKVFFNIPVNFKYLTFRSLITRFIRPKKSSYDSYKCFVNEEKEYQQILNNSFLLGLDIDRISKKRELKETWDEAKEKKRNIETDPIMQGFFTGDTDKKKIDIEIITLENKIKKLSANISDFKVSDDYNQIKIEADDLSRALSEYKNKRTLIVSSIKNIDKSLEIQPDIKHSDIVKLYDDANYQLSDLIIRRFEDVESFNKKLLNNRKARLLEEKKKFIIRLEKVESLIRELGQQEDEKLNLLNSTGSLEEYAKLNEQITQLTLKYKKLTEYKDLLNSYKRKIDSIKEEFVKENSETNKYLEKNESLKRKNIEVFNSFADQFYGNKPSGIIIENDEGENQNRFKIEATIDSDSGDGVNSVKIFCFDWTILKNQLNHKIGFLFHDSRLLSEMDPRQIATMFRLADSNSKENHLQYIISANQKELDAVKMEMLDEDFNSIIEKNVIEDLTDDNDSGKLLGISVDLNYEK